jgi:hypothetical protein
MRSAEVVKEDFNGKNFLPVTCFTPQGFVPNLAVPLLFSE